MTEATPPSKGPAESELGSAASRSLYKKPVLLLLVDAVVMGGGAVAVVSLLLLSRRLDEVTALVPAKLSSLCRGVMQRVVVGVR